MSDYTFAAHDDDEYVNETVSRLVVSHHQPRMGAKTRIKELLNYNNMNASMEKHFGETM